ncbi:hypothetical protein GC176_27855 [bacterium]|nr:hypothetical protein [bacterium]
MESTRLLATAMAERCRSIIHDRDGERTDLPEALRPKHLLWMCDSIQKHAEDWSGTRLHRRIGFIQAGMMANGMINLESARSMFDKAKVAHGAFSDDMLDHLDPSSQFELEIGGEG